MDEFHSDLWLEVKSHFMTGGLPQITFSSHQAPWDSQPEIFFLTEPLW
jgi:hypothetical protein